MGYNSLTSSSLHVTRSQSNPTDSGVSGNCIIWVFLPPQWDKRGIYTVPKLPVSWTGWSGWVWTQCRLPLHVSRSDMQWMCCRINISSISSLGKTHFPSKWAAVTLSKDICSLCHLYYQVGQGGPSQLADWGCWLLWVHILWSQNSE